MKVPENDLFSFLLTPLHINIKTGFILPWSEHNRAHQRATQCNQRKELLKSQTNSNISFFKYTRTHKIFAYFKLNILCAV